MASLTPGILQKLLQNADDKDFKVAGEHRSPLLQVISIVPSSIEDDPWKSRGYYLRVSDSLHSAYVSVPDEDVELILSDKVQLGQFIHVTRVDSGSPVPILRGIKAIPKRRPCLGDPKDLISSDFLNTKKVETKSKSNGKIRKIVGNEPCSNLRRLSFGGIDSRRLSFDSARKGWISSPQSKSGVDGALKYKPKDGSNSVVVKKGITENSPKSLSFSPIAKSKKVIPEKSLKISTLSPISKSKKTITENSPKSSTFSSSPLKNKNVIVSPKLKTKPVKSTKLTKPIENLKSQDDDSIFPIDLTKVVVSSKEYPEVNIAWDALPSTICDLGKEVRSFRNVAYGSAVRALEEASVCESVVRCMSMFGELCELSQKDTRYPFVERFLNIHESMKKASTSINTLIHSKTSHAKDGKKNASLWVQAAVETDLSKFSLYTHEEEKKSIAKVENFHYIVIENTAHKIPTENYSPKTIKQSTVAKVKSSHSTTKRATAAKSGSGLKDAEMLLEKLISLSRAWFLDYLENSLNNEFGSKSGESSQIAVLLGQLKRVIQWMEDAFRGDCVDERIEKLRKRLYRFLLDHVDSAVSHR